MRVWHLGLVLALAALPAAAQPKPDEPPKTEHYVCPPTRTLDCMPIVPVERQAYCTADYLDWAKKHCPGLEITH